MEPVANAAGRQFRPPTDISAPPAIVWDGYPNPVAADTKAGSTPSGTSHAIPYPTNLAIGDIVLVRCTTNGAALSPLTFPAAITLLAGGSRLTIWGGVGWRRVDGSEGLTFTATTPSAVPVIYHLLRITDAHASTAPEAGATVGDPCCVAQTNPSVSQYNPAGWGTEKTLWCATIGRGGVGAITAYPPLYPSGRTKTDAANVTQGFCYGKAEQAQAPGGIWTMGTVNIVRWTAAVRPRAA